MFEIVLQGSTHISVYKSKYYGAGQGTLYLILVFYSLAINTMDKDTLSYRARSVMWSDK